VAGEVTLSGTANDNGSRKETMSNPVSVKNFETKSHDSPDEVRTPSKTRVEIVRLAGFTLGRFTFQPGWRWSECIRPVVKTDSCQNSHLGYVVSGRITVALADGSKKTLGAGQSYSIPPGHDAWVEGNEPFVGLEIISAEQYAKPA
jgi:quercetin dioxygenase-like cupin family protein